MEGGEDPELCVSMARRLYKAWRAGQRSEGGDSMHRHAKLPCDDRTLRVVTVFECALGSVPKRSSAHRASERPMSSLTCPFSPLR